MNFQMNEPQNRTICQYYLRGVCHFGRRCWNIHEDPNKIVNRNRLIEREIPVSEGAQALSHSKSLNLDSLRSIYGPSASTVEEAISLVKISEDEEKTCGICFETILKKMPIGEQKFGILPNCNHCFCYACIKKWRQSKEFDIEVSKSCPECRIASDFVYPSRVWMNTVDDKKSFIDTQKKRMKTINCRYFRRGNGRCPFGNTCLYQHAFPDGTTVDVGAPSTRRRRGDMGYLDSEIMIQMSVWLNADDDDDDFLEFALPDPVLLDYYHNDVECLLDAEIFFDDSDSDYDVLLG